MANYDITITVPAADYAGHDALEAAERAAVALYGLEGDEPCARWVDDNRAEIALDIPEWAVARCPGVEPQRTYYTDAGDLHDYQTGDLLRRATEAEIAASDAAAEYDGGVGAFAGHEVL